MNPALRALKPYPMAELQQRKLALKESAVPVFDFGTGDPIEPTPVFITDAIRDAIPEISQYPTVAGTPAFRSAVAAYIDRRFGAHIDESQVLPSAGSKESIFHLPLAFLDPQSDKDTVIYGTPGYPVYQAGTLFAGGKEYPISLDAEHNFELDLTKVPENVLKRTQIVWLNYPHNPTGACVSEKYLQQQYAICQKYNIILASDECYSDLWFTHSTNIEKRPVSACTLSSELENVLIFQSCSKRSGMTGYRSGFITGDQQLINKYRRWRAAMGVGSPSFITAAATAAWNDDTHVIERRSIFSAKRKLLEEGLKSMNIEVLPAAAGLYIWARTPAGFTDDEYAHCCLQLGIIISPGGFFGNGGAGFFRLSLVPSLADCAKALKIWPT